MTAAPEQVYWKGPPPSACDACRRHLEKAFYDMRSLHGPWGNFCPRCAFGGPGIGKVGPGLGQEYEQQPDGRWLKVRG